MNPDKQMIQLELTPEIKRWLDTDPAERDLRYGAEMLLRITRNRILYNNLMRNLAGRAEMIEYQLGKIYKQRMMAITHEEVTEMMAKVEQINAVRNLDGQQPTRRTEMQRGRRLDHDQLPPEIQKLYVDNADLMRRMRECHLHLRMINEENSTCPDNDRFPWCKEIIALDDQYRTNWNVYDHYVKGTPPAAAVPVVDARTASRNAAKLCPLLLGHYAKKPTPELADRIRATYAKIASPTPSLRSKMADAGLLNS